MLGKANDTKETITETQLMAQNRATEIVFREGDLVKAVQMARLENGLSGYYYVQGATSWGFCAENGKDYWNNNQSKSGYITEWNNANVRKILYYAPGSPGYTGTNEVYDMDNTTFSIGYMNGMSANNTRAKAHIANLEKLQDPIIWGYKAYKINITPDNYQDVAFLAHCPKGVIEIVKESSNKDVTEGNHNYSLEGAVYGVYAADGDYSAPEYKITLTAWEDGWSGLPVGVEYGWGYVEVPPGDYWVQEIEAPPGYERNLNWYPSYDTPMTVDSSQTVRVNVKDEPQMMPLDILLEKVKEEENPLSLMGAQFRITHYGTLLEDATIDPNTMGENALQEIKKRSWLFVTDENGMSRFQEEFLISGDELYYNSEGIPSLPIGTITIQEEKAPEGYLLNTEMFVRQIALDVNTGTWNAYAHPIISEKTIDLNLVKLQTGTEIPISGAVFEHKMPNGDTVRITTDTNGQLHVRGLHYGVHELREVIAPEGYALNEKIMKFSVEEDNSIVFLSPHDETMVGNVSEEGSIQLTVYDDVLPYSFVIYKQNEEGKPLKGAEFGLFTDKECTQILKSGVSDSEGVYKIDNLLSEKTYYLKELKAPDGYRLPMGEDGNPVVIELKTIRVPTRNEFKLYVQGEEYDFGASDEFWIKGTENDREIGVKIVNEKGYRLPQTGSGRALLCIAGGTALSFLCIWKMKFNKKEKRHYEK